MIVLAHNRGCLQLPPMAPSPLPPTAAVLLALAPLVARSTLATIPLYCRAGTLGGSTLGVANLTVWEAARQCSSLLGGRCAGWTTPEVYPAVCDPKSTVVYQIQFKDKNSLGRPVNKTGWSYFRAIPLPPLPSPSPSTPAPHSAQRDSPADRAAGHRSRTLLFRLGPRGLDGCHGRHL
eukprot:COSAG06_NODE_21581_length_752_cov_0.808576_1_plen_177_part_10